MKFLAVFLLSLPVLAVLVLLLVLWGGMREQKKMQDAIVRKVKGKPFWRVCMARSAYIKRGFKLLPGECCGVLIDEGEQLCFAGRWGSSGKTFSWSAAKDELRLEYVGNPSLRSGNLYWAKVQSPEGEVYFAADTGFLALPSRQALQDILFAAFPNFDLDEEEQVDFALNKHPRSRLAMALLFIPVIAAAIDSYIISRYELAEAQVLGLLITPTISLPALLLIGLVGVCSYRWLLGGGVPARESFALAGMAAVSVAIAYVPALKRIDQHLADKGTQDYAYELVGLGKLEPIDPLKGQPKFLFRKANEYWAQFEVGSTYQVPLLHGPLGLWQMDHDRFDPPIRTFYEKLSAR